jgi:poly-gamma-glutamate capsule biosynthesis protein CapA/YwtB (metallophosphatase superfamily)
VSGCVPAKYVRSETTTCYLESGGLVQQIIRLTLGGDLMLGRDVADRITASGADYPLGPLAERMAGADVTIVSLDGAIVDNAAKVLKRTNPSAALAPPIAIHTLLDAGIDLVSLANEHALDGGILGLRNTLRVLDTHGIRVAGAGVNDQAASAPAVIDVKGTRVGVLAYSDRLQELGATGDRAGIAYLAAHDQEGLVQQFRDDLERIPRPAVDWPILSLHWGLHLARRPTPFQELVAHAAVDAGWKIVFGHGSHCLQGIEIYQGCPILYSTGDLVTDLYTAPDANNDHTLLFELELCRSLATRINLIPLRIEACQARRARGTEFELVADQIRILSAELGTPVDRDGTHLWIDVAPVHESSHKTGLKRHRS